MSENLLALLERTPDDDAPELVAVDVRRALEGSEELLVHTPGRPTGQETPVELIGQ